MVNYRRGRVAGGSYFFIVTLQDRQSTALVDHIADLRKAFRWVHKRRPFRIRAIVVLPDHLHTIWTLPGEDADYPGRWRAIKSRFTRSLVESGTPLRRNARGECLLWQRRYWEHTLRDLIDMQRHIDYIHYNPVKHGHVRVVGDWPYSSFHRFVEAGVYPRDWAGGETDFEDIGRE